MAILFSQTKKNQHFFFEQELITTFKFPCQIFICINGNVLPESGTNGDF